MTAMVWYRAARRLYLLGVPVLPRLIYLLTRLLFACSVPFTAEIGANTRLGYGGLGVVIHADTVIGEGCLVSHHVTIGGLAHRVNRPRLGDRVYVGTAAVILGSVTIGDGAVIGANAVVLDSVPAGGLAVGVPAQVVKTGVQSKDYL